MLRVLLSIVIISVAGISAAEGGLLGANRCTYGPGYWCGSLGKAKECSAVPHCISSVWHGLALPRDGDGVCELCEEMVEEARAFIGSNGTEASVEELFDETCRLIPLQSVKELCLEMGADYIPELLLLLESEMEPQEVCAALSLCNSVDIDRQLRESNLTGWRKPVAEKRTAVVTYSDPDPEDCQDCKDFLADMQHLTTKYGKDELLSHLQMICGELGALSDGCATLVEINIDLIYNFIAYQMDVDQVCDLFDMCENVSRAEVLRAHSGDEGCDFCVMAADYVRRRLVANSTKEHYRQALEGLCEQTGSFALECQALVDTYYASSYDWLLNEFDALRVCEVVGLCGAQDQTRPVWTTLDATRGQGKTLPIRRGSWAGGDEANAIQVSVMGENGVLGRDDNTCMLCQFTLHFVQQELNDNANREQIEHFVKGVCVYLPNTLAEECQDYIDAYGDQVIALLEQEIDPSVICPELHLCPAVVSASHGLRDVAFTSHHLRDVSCVMCEYAMMNFKQLLGDRTNEADVQHALDQLCSVMPHSLSGQCTTFVDQNTVEIMELIADGIQPEQVCAQLGLCDQNRIPEPVFLVFNRPTNQQPPPMFTGDELGAFTTTNQLVGDTLRGGEDQPIEALAELTPANQLPLSRMFGHASSVTTEDVLLAHQAELEANLGQKKGCMMCEFVIKTLEHMVLDKDTGIEEEIRTAVEQVCVLMPMTLADDCLTFVDRYGEQIVKMFVNSLDPKDICTELTLCEPKTVLGMGVPLALPSRQRRSAPLAPHPEACVVCKALTNSPAEVVCAHAVNDLEGFTPAQCAQLDTEACKACQPKPAAPGSRPLLGTEKCTYGPAYFCKSRLHAHSCGGQQTEDACKRMKSGFAAAP